MTLRWRHTGGAAAYAVYRAAGRDGDAVLLTTVRAADGGQDWTDATASGGGPYTYCVTALDRAGNQSGAAGARVVS